MWEADAASRSLGIRIRDVSDGQATAEMTVTEAMVNGLGLLHGGLTFTLADTAMAFASNGGEASAVASHADIDFLAPGRIGQRLVASAERRSKVGRTSIFDVVVTADGQAMAQFRGRTRDLQSRT